MNGAKAAGRLVRLRVCAEHHAWSLAPAHTRHAMLARDGAETLKIATAPRATASAAGEGLSDCCAAVHVWRLRFILGAMALPSIHRSSRRRASPVKPARISGQPHTSIYHTSNVATPGPAAFHPNVHAVQVCCVRFRGIVSACHPGWARACVLFPRHRKARRGSPWASESRVAISLQPCVMPVLPSS